MADVDEIVDYIFADNLAAALDLEQLIHDSVNHLTRLPYIGWRGRVMNTWELIFHPNHFIVYELDETHVKIMRIVHTRRKYPA
ncbi:type II toxin-antitoxin system RelE/ParE family toxin [Eikenella corrodens]|uniref:Type II toxin-antitoxin system RelE/ParE family toxin n=1 Tax=Eikenella corrodens TaxID=539 RepID=A0A3S9SID7_EIKCO|nr:type II toxin-antitoxin system RelE/ParE family toxin [Eikenella corrodens]AZR59282.1 type II toxin-antitoxin system RelE/ParE family toxin [Eikenella corrodens]